MALFNLYVEEAKRFEDGLQEQKDFLSIQRKFVSLILRILLTSQKVDFQDTSINCPVHLCF